METPTQHGTVSYLGRGFVILFKFEIIRYKIKKEAKHFTEFTLQKIWSTGLDGFSQKVFVFIVQR